MEPGPIIDPIHDYRDLKVWKDSMDLAVDIYAMTRSFPKEEVYGLTAQMRRSVVSISSNIAEGFGRGQRGSFIQFLRIAQGSLKELESQTVLAQRLGFADGSAAPLLAERYQALGKMLRAFIASLERKGER